MKNRDPLKPPFNVVVLDDHRFIGELLALKLQTDSSFQVLASATRAQTVYDLVAGPQRVDIVLLDMDLGDDDGLNVARLLLELRPAVRIVGLSAHAETRYPLTLLEIGGCGFLSKNSSVHDLVSGLQRVARGDLAISPDVALHLATGVHDGGARRVGALTGKESEVLRLLSHGRSVDEISSTLGISVKTVQSHRSSMKRKLRARTDVELALIALRAGLVGVRESG
ncbi:MAG: response regulator [Gammaproteobacteria bacterium]